MLLKPQTEPKNMNQVDSDFRQRVYELVRQIPKGRVMTYGQIATLCGSPRAARIVGGIAHWGDPKLPWQRVVMKDGSLASGFPGGTAGHAEALKLEGITVSDQFKIDIDRFLWYPTND